jgi:transposase
VLLYFFLSAVADRHGISFYGDGTLAAMLRMVLPALFSARDEMLGRDLIAHEALHPGALPAAARPAPPGGAGPRADATERVVTPDRCAARFQRTKESAMRVALGAEIRRLAEIEKLSGRAISRRLHCSWRTVAAALELDRPPARQAVGRRSFLDAHRAKVDALLAKDPELSAIRIHEEIARGPSGNTGSTSVICRYLRTILAPRGRVYQEVHYEPAQAMQVDWGECGRVRVGTTTRKVSVFVAVLCYSRLMFIEFTLSQRKEEFYRCLVHALEFFGGSPRAVIFDNLKAAVKNDSGRAACFHPEFLALCGYFCLQLIACDRRDPESKGSSRGACATSSTTPWRDVPRS